MIRQANEENIEEDDTKCFVCGEKLPSGPWRSLSTKMASIESGIFFYSPRYDKAERKEIHKKCYKKMVGENVDLKYATQHDLILIETPGITAWRLMKLWNYRFDPDLNYEIIEGTNRTVFLQNESILAGLFRGGRGEFEIYRKGQFSFCILWKEEVKKIMPQYKDPLGKLAVDYVSENINQFKNPPKDTLKTF